MERFVIACERVSVPVDKMITEKLEASGLNWWHWWPGLWIVEANDLDVEQVFNMFLEVAPPTRFFVLRLKQGSHDWLAMGPASEKVFDWFDEYIGGSKLGSGERIDRPYAEHPKLSKADDLSATVRQFGPADAEHSESMQEEEDKK